MISPTFATIVLITFIVIFGIGVPILNNAKPKYVSYRWCVIVVVLALLIGAVINFESMQDEIRHCLLIGGLVIAGGYVLLRTAEKVLANGWLKGSKIELHKGDLSATISSETEKVNGEAKEEKELE